MPYLMKRMMIMKKQNIVLIGMPGAGKSTIGVILAKTLKMPFIDTDLLIQQEEDMLLQDIIYSRGIEGFLAAEEKVITKIKVQNHVIATGGSVVYSKAAVTHLKNSGKLVYLKLSYDEIEKRIQNITTRGIAMTKNQSLVELYEERIPLYERYADTTVDCSGKNTEKVIEEIKSKIKDA